MMMMRSRSSSARRAEALDVFWRVGMQADREQLALDQVGLGRLPGADRDVGLAHRQIEFLVGDDQRDADVRWSAVNSSSRGTSH